MASKAGELGELHAAHAALTKQYDEAVHRANLARQASGSGQGGGGTSYSALPAPGCMSLPSDCLVPDCARPAHV